jgi:hypothetical protein
MRRATIRTVAFAALAVVGWASVSCAQDGRATDARDNPFLPSPTEEEDKRIAERERMRQVVREMMPEYKALIQEQVGIARAQTQDDIKKAIAEIPKPDPSIQIANVGAAQAGALAVPGNPAAAVTTQASAPAEFRGARLRPAPTDGAKYLACVNEKPLYRDGKDGMRFYVDAPCK